MILTNEHVRNLLIVFNKLIEDHITPIEKAAEVVNFYSELIKQNQKIDERILDLQEVYKDKIEFKDEKQIKFKSIEYRDAYIQDTKNIFDSEIELPNFQLTMENLRECKSLVPKDLIILSVLMK